MRQDIEFDAEGTTLRGWLYVPDEATGPVPTIVMCHGYSAVKELFLDAFAEVFCEAGSLRARLRQPQPRGLRRRAAPGDRPVGAGARLPARDHLRAHARRGRLRPDRLWGSSYSGAHVLVVGAIDRRVKCVVAQVPLISGHENARRLVRADLIAPTQEMFAADREARYRGRRRTPSRSSRRRASRARCRPPTATSGSRRRAPSARRRGVNECTLRSVEMFWEYEPGAYLPCVSPTPLLMVVAAGDHLTVSDLAIGGVRAGTRAEAARDPARRALRRLHRRLRGVQRRGA